MLLMLRIVYVLLWLGLLVPPVLAAVILARGGGYPYLLEVIGIGSSLIMVFFYTRTRLPFVFLHKTKRDAVIQFYFRYQPRVLHHGDSASVEGIVMAALYGDFVSARQLLALHGEKAKAEVDDLKNSLEALLLVLAGAWGEAEALLDEEERPVKQPMMRRVDRDNFHHNVVRALCRVFTDRGGDTEHEVLVRAYRGGTFVWRMLSAWALAYYLRDQEREPFEHYRELVTVVGEPFPLLHGIKPPAIMVEQTSA